MRKTNKNYFKEKFEGKKKNHKIYLRVCNNKVNFKARGGNLKYYLKKKTLSRVAGLLHCKLSLMVSKQGRLHQALAPIGIVLKKKNSLD